MNTQNKKLSPEQQKELESFKKWLEDNKYSPKDEKEVADLYKKYKSQKTKKAAHGAKLDYVKSLKHICPEGQELVYFKKLPYCDQFVQLVWTNGVFKQIFS